MFHTDAAQEKIRNACREVIAVRPFYAEMLNFYESVFLSQEAAVGDTQVSGLDIPDDILAMKISEKLPLISPADFAIDTVSATRLLQKLLRIADTSTSPEIQAAARTISESMDSGTLHRNNLFDFALGKEVSGDIPSGLSADMALLFGYNSIRPSVRLISQHLSAALDAGEPWQTGYCPICGSSPGLSLLKADGDRWYVCSFCWHEWLTPRIYCPFCDNTDSSQLHYFFSDAEPEYRVEGCGRCNRYIKTVDMRKTSRTIVPVVEAIATLHLDIQAGAQTA